jgi:hypothetical protein
VENFRGTNRDKNPLSKLVNSERNSNKLPENNFFSATWMGWKADSLLAVQVAWSEHWLLV